MNINQAVTTDSLWYAHIYNLSMSQGTRQSTWALASADSHPLVTMSHRGGNWRRREEAGRYHQADERWEIKPSAAPQQGLNREGSSVNQEKKSCQNLLTAK